MTELPSSISHARGAYSLASDGSTLTDFTEEASPWPSALSVMLARMIFTATKSPKSRESNQ
jgi:hypothetical protein